MESLEETRLDKIGLIGLIIKWSITFSGNLGWLNKFQIKIIE